MDCKKYGDIFNDDQALEKLNWYLYLHGGTMD